MDMLDSFNDKPGSEGAIGVTRGFPALDNLVAEIDNETIAALGLQPPEDDREEKAADRRRLGRHIYISLAGFPLVIPMTWILEVGELAVVRQLPLLPEWLLGVTSIRGEILSLVDLRRFLGLPAADLKPEQPLLIVHNDIFKTAVIVDRILGLRSPYLVDDEKAGSLPGKGRLVDFLLGETACTREGEEDEILYLFDIEGFLSSSDMTEFLD